MINPFTLHPKSVGETYFQHFCFASASGIRLILAGIACVIHSIFPFLFVNTASNTMQKISDEIIKRKNEKKQ